MSSSCVLLKGPSINNIFLGFLFFDLPLYQYQRCSSVQFWVNHKFVKEGRDATTDKVEGRGTLSLSPGPVMTSRTQQEWCITDNHLAIQSVEGIFRHGLPDGDVTIKQHNMAEIKAFGIT